MALPQPPEPTSAPARFNDRRAAGRILASALRRFRGDDPVVLALPRGGVPVAYEVAEALGAELDLILVRKIGAPGHAEYGMGALVEAPEPHLVLNDAIVERVRPPPGYIEAEAARQREELERRRAVYRHGRPAVPLHERTVIVVDDGIATGGTMRAVLEAVREQQPCRIVLAVPVAAADTLEALAPLADDTVCLATPTPFYAVGQHYRDFTQTGDGEVVRLLDAAQHARRSGAAPASGAGTSPRFR